MVACTAAAAAEGHSRYCHVGKPSWDAVSEYVLNSAAPARPNREGTGMCPAPLKPPSSEDLGS